MTPQLGGMLLTASDNDPNTNCLLVGLSALCSAVMLLGIWQSLGVTHDQPTTRNAAPAATEGARCHGPRDCCRIG